VVVLGGSVTLVLFLIKEGGGKEEDSVKSHWKLRTQLAFEETEEENEITLLNDNKKISAEIKKKL
jgi:hypothetical protein